MFSSSSVFSFALSVPWLSLSLRVINVKLHSYTLTLDRTWDLSFPCKVTVLELMWEVMWYFTLILIYWCQVNSFGRQSVIHRIVRTMGTISSGINSEVNTFWFWGKYRPKFRQIYPRFFCTFMMIYLQNFRVKKTVKRLELLKNT